MATSGSYDFALDRDGLITAAYRFIGAIAVGENPTTDELTNGGQILNLMLKGWQAEGIALWLNKKATLFLDYNTQSYSIGPSGGNVCLTSDAVKTEVRVAASSTDTTLEVDSTTGMTAGDYIGVQLDDGTLQWTTIDTVTDTDTLELTDALTDDVAVDNHVYTYTTKLQRPLGIIEARRVDKDNISTPLFELSRQEYMALSLKSALGITTQYYFDPQLTNAALYVWPTASLVTDTLEMTVKMPIQDMDASADDGEFPVEWSEAVVLNLARRIGIQLGVPVDKELKELAAEAKYMAKTFDDETASLYFQPRER